MKTTIDRAGRIVVPKALREAAGIAERSEVTIRAVDGRIEIEPLPLDVRIVRRGALTVAVPRHPTGRLAAETVRETFRDVRRRGWRDQP